MPSKGLRGAVARLLQAMPDGWASRIRATKRGMLNLRSQKAVFTEIARNNSWQGTESISGPGSTLEATARLREALPDILEKYQIGSLLDIPCGDAHWISQALPTGIDYIGADIVADLIASNMAGKTRLGRFEVLDLVSSPLPSCDLVMTRDCLIHLPNHMVRRALANIKRSGARYILTTTYPGRADNIDIEIGGYRPIDLQAAPFNLPAPLEIILENEGVSSGKSIALWPTRNL